MNTHPLSSSLHAQLKRATQEQHHALHGHALLDKLMRPQLSRTDFAKIISAFYGAYTHAEGLKKISPFEQESPVLFWLGKDMQRIGAGAPLPLQTLSFPVITELSAYAGYLYVKEGSTLGGQVISRQLEKNSGMRAGSDQFFYAGHGADTHTHWHTFLAWLERNESVINADIACVHAQVTFALIKAYCDHAIRH